MDSGRTERLAAKHPCVNGRQRLPTACAGISSIALIAMENGEAYATTDKWDCVKK